MGLFQKNRPSEIEESDVFITSSLGDNGQLSQQDNPKPEIDRVLTRALKENLISEADIERWSENRQSPPGTSRNAILGWKQACKLEPWRTQQFERLAARVYGFRSILVCQMSTLVLADQLTAKISPTMWEEMFELGLAPVVEHGRSPDVEGRVVCISKDPSNKQVRGFTNSTKSFTPELAYADANVVSGVLELIAQHIPAIGASVYVARPVLRKVSVRPLTNRQAA